MPPKLDDVGSRYASALSGAAARLLPPKPAKSPRQQKMISPPTGAVVVIGGPGANDDHSVSRVLQ